MDTKVDRLIDYFSVVGLGKQLQPNQDNNEADHKITGLEVVLGYINIDPETLGSTNEKWLDINGSKTIWLKISLDQQKPAITKFGLFKIPLDEKGRLLVPLESSLKPVSIKKLNSKEPSTDRCLGKTLKYVIYKGNYDLTYYLTDEIKQNANHQLVMCLREQSDKNFKPPLCDIKIAEVQKNPNGVGVSVALPKFYKARKFRLGRKKSRIFTYRKCANIESVAYAPTVLCRYPQVNHEDLEFPAAIALFCFPHGITLARELRTPQTFSFILTQQDGARLYGACLTFDEEFPASSLEKLGHIKVDAQNPLYMQKALCITSSYPFTQEYLEFLRQLYRIHLSKSEIPIERYIGNFVDEVPLPDRGGAAVAYEIGSNRLVFKHSDKYPVVSDASIINLFTVLSISNIITLFEFLLLERKIFLISKHKSLLTSVIEALTGLFYPFVWTHVLIPILPDGLAAYSEAPVPFIIGVHNQSDQDEIVHNLSSDIVKVHLDFDNLIFTDTIPHPPEKHLKHLLKRLEPYSFMNKDYQTKIEFCDEAFRIRMPDLDDELERFDPLDVRDAFFEFMCAILKYTPKCFVVSKQKDNIELKDIFDIREFLSLNKSKAGSFLHKLTETSLFSYFIERRVLDTPMTEDYQFIDLALRTKRAKKSQITLPPFEPPRIVAALPPNRGGLLSSQQFFQYKVFPRLDPALFSLPRELHKTHKVRKSIHSLEIEESATLIDDNQWAQIMLDTLYTLWFWLLGLKVTTNRYNYLPKITERGLSMLDQMRSNGFEPNGTILKSIIQACCASSMPSKALEIVTQVQERKNEVLPHAHGIYLEAMAKAKGCEISVARLDSSGKLPSKVNKDRALKSESFHSFGEERKTNDKEDDSHTSNADAESVSDTMSRDNAVPYIYFFSFIDSIKKAEDDKINPEDILRAWRRSFDADNNNEEKEIKGLRIVIHEHKDRLIKKREVEWICPIIMKRRLEYLNHESTDGGFLNNKFEEKHPDLYWNLVVSAHFIKAPSLFFEYYQNHYSVAEALRDIEVEEALKREKGNGLVNQVTNMIRSNSDMFKLNERKQFAGLFHDLLKKIEKGRVDFENEEKTRKSEVSSTRIDYAESDTASEQGTPCYIKDPSTPFP